MATPNKRRRTYKDLLNSAKKYNNLSPVSSPVSSPCSSPCSSPLSSPRSRKLLFDDIPLPNIQPHADFLSSLPLKILETTTPDNIALSLISQFGLNVLCSLAFALARIPANFPDRNRYLTNIVNFLSNVSLQENVVASLQRLVELKLQNIIPSFSIDHSYGNQRIWECSVKFQEPYNAFLVPPVYHCIHMNCNGEIYFFHKSTVTLHTFEGPVPAQKATFRCKQCKSIYNIDSYSCPGEGSRFYPFKTEWTSASNRVYYSRDLHEFLCESGNHAFVSHQAFSEIYNTVFCYSTNRLTAMTEVMKVPDSDNTDETESCSEDEGNISGAAGLMTRKQANAAYFNGELVNELLERKITETTVISTSKTREDIFREIDTMRRNELYQHNELDCSDECKKKGCEHLRVIDSCWKVCMPHCMFSVENEVQGYPLINFPDVCTNEPLPNSVFCLDHQNLLKKNGIPTKKEDFLKHIGCKANPSSKEDITNVDKQILHLAKSLADSVKIGTSAPNYQGLEKMIDKSDKNVWTVVDTCKSTCNKDTGEKARLRQRSRGHFISVTGGGHIQFFNPIFKSESPCQIFMLVIRTIYLELKDKTFEEQESALEKYILSYDNICHLDSLNAAAESLPLPAPFDTMWIRIKKIIDRLHIQNHKDPKCRELYNPSTIPEEYNTMIAEQTFAWFSRFKKNANSMTQSHHLFFVHRNIKRRNRYTSTVRHRGKEPLLPGVNPNCKR